ncbi:MAG: hypothetical protein K2X87_23960 [Gemmataceae bacterium]|nr:hypothetical protein [Gemmataceae bacterium]
MTAAEFGDKFNAYDWDLYQPLAVLLKDGRRTYIDPPGDQARPRPDELVIIRRSNPKNPERHRYEEITDLVGMLDLPADQGRMSYAEFDSLIRQYLMADPFLPFAVELRSGEVLEVKRRPDLGRVCRHLRWHGTPGRPDTYYTFDDVARLVPRMVPVPAGGNGHAA